MHACFKEQGNNFLLRTCLPTDSKLEDLKSVNATTVRLLCKLDFVIHSFRSILKLIQKRNKFLVFVVTFDHLIDMQT